MFRTVNPYDEVVAKATAETATDENWDIFVAVWDKVNEDGEAGARNCVAALQRRLQHRNANVQLFALTLSDGLVSNCGAPLHREICGKAFTQTLVKLVNDRTTHENVKKKVLKTIAGWVKTYGKDSNFDLMVETYESLKSQHGNFDEERSNSPEGPSDEVRRREEADLQRALAESAALANPLKGFQKSQPTSSDPYSHHNKNLPRQPPSPQETSFIPPQTSSVVEPTPTVLKGQSSRVRALYDFDTQSPNELSFAKGDVINVVGREYPEWWNGELRGKRGIFPITYIEEIPDPAPAPNPPPQPQQQQQQQFQREEQRPTSAMSEEEMEAQLFAQSASIDKLLNMMRSLDPQSQNLAQNEELLELYSKSMQMRPKVVKLIEKYDKKQAELRKINDKFTKASTTYHQIVEESQMRHNTAPNPYGGVPPNGYDYSQQGQGQPQPQPQPQADGRPDPRALAGLSPDQRREYEQQWAQYEQQLAAYHAQQQAYFAQAQQHAQFAAAPPTGQNGTGGQPQDPAYQQQQQDAAYQLAYQQQMQQAQLAQQAAAAAAAGQQHYQDPSQAVLTPVADSHPQAHQQQPGEQQQLQPYYDQERGWVWPDQNPPPAQHGQPSELAPQTTTSPPPPHQQQAQLPFTSQAAQFASPPAPGTQAYAQGTYQLTDQLQALAIDPASVPAPQSPPLTQGQPQQGFDPRIAAPGAGSPQLQAQQQAQQAYYQSFAPPPAGDQQAWYGQQSQAQGTQGQEYQQQHGAAPVYQQ